MPALVRCTLSMKISLLWRERAAAASPSSRIRAKSPSTNATKASDCAAAMNDMSSPRRAASAVASADVARAADRSPARTSKAAWFARIRTRRSEEHTSELQSQFHLVCRLLLEKKNTTTIEALVVD